MARLNSSFQSLETILNFENSERNNWSVIWSTTHVPGMDTATGAARRRLAGRRRLRIVAFTLAALLSMHCRVVASALTGGFFIFIMCLAAGIALLANPFRHFEIYLGEWSISGPGRAFRIIPMLDGIGIAICINAIVRAIICCIVAAIALLYVFYSLSDSKLPFTYCRDFNLKPYDPVLKDVKILRMLNTTFAMESPNINEDELYKLTQTTVGMRYLAWRNVTYNYLRDYNILSSSSNESRLQSSTNQRKVAICRESYPGSYPALYSTPAYNFFYVEVVRYRSEFSFRSLNIPMVISIISIWCILWICMLYEKLANGRLIWNNMHVWFVLVPWLWTGLITVTACMHITTTYKSLRKVFRVGSKEILSGVSDALEVSLYVHSASTGTEIIHGKGLNHYASGHIDPNLNIENVIHSCLVLLLTTIHTAGAAICALVDYIQPKHRQAPYDMNESSLWIIPMYSKCAVVGNYSHLLTTLIFGGLMFSYITVAYVMLKTALHTIFEYRVKLVFIEQAIVAALILTCMSLSIIFATSSGVALLEGVDAIMTGVAMPYLCLLELVGLLYVYRGRDFISDMHVATEDNTCSTRIGTQWQIIPFVTLITLFLKISLVVSADMPRQAMYASVAPLACVLVAVPLRAAHNAYMFLHPKQRQ